MIDDNDDKDTHYIVYGIIHNTVCEDNVHEEDNVL